LGISMLSKNPLTTPLALPDPAVLPLAESCMNSPIWILPALYILPPGFTLSIAKTHQLLAWTGLTCRPSWSPALG
jgi:hypothetical protein